jgi:hypothetical protein
MAQRILPAGPAVPGPTTTVRRRRRNRRGVSRSIVGARAIDVATPRAPALRAAILSFPMTRPRPLPGLPRRPA